MWSRGSAEQLQCSYELAGFIISIPAAKPYTQPHHCTELLYSMHAHRLDQIVSIHRKGAKRMNAASAGSSTDQDAGAPRACKLAEPPKARKQGGAETEKKAALVLEWTLIWKTHLYDGCVCMCVCEFAGLAPYKGSDSSSYDISTSQLLSTSGNTKRQVITNCKHAE